MTDTAPTVDLWLCGNTDDLRRFGVPILGKNHYAMLEFNDDLNDGKQQIDGYDIQQALSGSSCSSDPHAVRRAAEMSKVALYVRVGPYLGKSGDRLKPLAGIGLGTMVILDHKTVTVVREGVESSRKLQRGEQVSKCLADVIMRLMNSNPSISWLIYDVTHPDGLSASHLDVVIAALDQLRQPINVMLTRGFGTSFIYADLNVYDDDHSHVVSLRSRLVMIEGNKLDGQLDMRLIGTRKQQKLVKTAATEDCDQLFYELKRTAPAKCVIV
jgi:hypothetical protein